MARGGGKRLTTRVRQFGQGYKMVAISKTYKATLADLLATDTRELMPGQVLDVGGDRGGNDFIVLPTSDTSTADNGIVFDITNNGNTRKIRRQFSGAVWATWWPIVEGGATTTEQNANATHFQTILANFKHIRWPAGTFRFGANTITVASTRHVIRGESSDNNGGTIFRWAATLNGPGIEVRGDRHLFSDFALLMSTTATTDRGLVLNGCTRSKFHNITVDGGTQGIVLRNSWVLDFKGCEQRLSRSVGVLFEANGTQPVNQAVFDGGYYGNGTPIAIQVSSRTRAIGFKDTTIEGYTQRGIYYNGTEPNRGDFFVDIYDETDGATIAVEVDAPNAEGLIFHNYTIGPDTDAGARGFWIKQGNATEIGGRYISTVRSTTNIEPDIQIDAAATNTFVRQMGEQFNRLPTLVDNSSSTHIEPIAVATIDGLSASRCWNGTSATVGTDRGGEFTYHSTGRATNAADGGTKFNGPGADDWWERNYTGRVNVMWFGALADNATDNSPFFTAAQAVADARNTAVYVPGNGGTNYRIFSTVNLLVPMYGDNSDNGRTTIQGRMSDASSMFQSLGVGAELHDLTFHKSFTNGACLKVGDEATLNSSTLLTVVNCHFRGNRNAGSTGIGVLLDYAWNTSFHGCKFMANGTGVKTTLANSTSFHGCVFEDNGVAGIEVQGGSSIGLYGGVVQGNGNAPPDTGTGVLISGHATHTTRNIAINDMYFEGDASASQALHMDIGSAANEVEDVTIRGCQFGQKAGDINLIGPTIKVRNVDGCYFDKDVAARCKIEVDDGCRNVHFEGRARYGGSSHGLLAASGNAGLERAPLNLFANPYGKGGWRGLNGATTLSNLTATESTTVVRDMPTSLQLDVTGVTTTPFARVTLDAAMVEQWRGRRIYTGGWYFVPSGQTATLYPDALLELTIDGAQTFSTQNSAQRIMNTDRWVFVANHFDVPTTGVFTNPRLRIAASWLSAANAGDTVYWSGLFLTETHAFGEMMRGLALDPERFQWQGDSLITYAAGPPTDTVGLWSVGDKFIDGNTEWRCTVAGAPGTWVLESSDTAFIDITADNPTLATTDNYVVTAGVTLTTIPIGVDGRELTLRVEATANVTAGGNIDLDVDGDINNPTNYAFLKLIQQGGAWRQSTRRSTH